MCIREIQALVFLSCPENHLLLEHLPQGLAVHWFDPAFLDLVEGVAHLPPCEEPAERITVDFNFVWQDGHEGGVESHGICCSGFAHRCPSPSRTLDSA